MAPGSCSARARSMGNRTDSSPGMASRNSSKAILFAALLEEFGDEAGPARLMACAQAGSVIAVEVFVKQNQVAPMRIALKNVRSAGDGAAPGAIAQKDMDQAARELRRNLPEVGFAIRMSGAFDFEVFAEVVMKLLQG